MKIIVKYEVSQFRDEREWDIEDLGYSIEEWNKLGDDDKTEILVDMMESNPPYWVVDSFKSIENESK